MKDVQSKFAFEPDNFQHIIDSFGHLLVRGEHIDLNKQILIKYTFQNDNCPQHIEVFIGDRIFYSDVDVEGDKGVCLDRIVQLQTQKLLQSL